MFSGWYPCVCSSVRPLPYVRPSVLLFQDGNLSKYQWIFTKLGMCFNIIKNSFRTANRRIS